MDKAVVDAVKQSFGRALINKDLMKDFYDRLMSDNPAVGKMFARTDLEKQKEILKMSLSMAILFSQDNVVAKHAMDKVRESHSQANLNIKPEFYTVWLNSLVSVVAVSDPEFSSELEQHWRLAIGQAINHIKSGYLPEPGS